MKTKRIITIQNVKDFFRSAINTMDNAMGVIYFNTKENTVEIDFNGVLLLRFDDVFASLKYEASSTLFDEAFRSVLRTIKVEAVGDDYEIEYVRVINEDKYHFVFKIEHDQKDVLKIYIISYDVMLETEQQLALFSNVVGAGVSVFAGCTWWIDYDRYDDFFYQSDNGPNLLGIPINEHKLYNIKAFQKFRDRARTVSELYDESIQTEAEAYEKVRRNETDFFGGRSPIVTADDTILWVEAYGKCLLRYPDGRPRFSIAIDIYMSEVFEKINQLEIIRNVTEAGLTSSDIGVFYHQRHFKVGRYYFTDSFNKLMSSKRVYKNENIKEYFDEQEHLLSKLNQGYEQYIVDYRETHNDIFYNKIDKYHVIIPNLKDEHTLQWLDIRGTVIERTDDGAVDLFVAVVVDVTESYQRRIELEELRVKNERLQLAERLAINARNILVWYQNHNQLITDHTIIANDMFEKKLGLKPNKEGLIEFDDLRKTLVMDTQKDRDLATVLLSSITKVLKKEVQSFSGLMAKHQHLKTGETFFLEHSLDVSDVDSKNPMIGGVLIDVTKTQVYQERIQYLADYDTLTDTYNRNYFEAFIKTKLPASYTIMIFDVDGLKLINDAFGHFEGDNIIKQLAHFLKEIFINALFVARIGGDEFVVLTGETDHHIVNQYVTELERQVEAYNNHSSIEMSISMGGMDVLNQSIDFDKAFVQAENIMYRRKLNNRSSRKSKVLESIIETLNAKTEETKAHSQRMADLAVETIQALGYVRASEREDIRLLAKVHDVGKITIPDEILQKPSALTPEEYEVIKKHSEAGYKIIRNITDSDHVCNGVLFHHERFDGTGYPQGLKGKEIPLFARVISVVDSFDAMTHNRIYQAQKSEEEALEELKKYAGTQFDPMIVDVFIKNYKKRS
jgi:diguanylate cyclase (GGDEF)-like protein